MLAKIAATMCAAKVVGGHHAAPDSGVALQAYAVGGPADYHEAKAEEDAILHARQGMRSILRLG